MKLPLSLAEKLLLLLQGERVPASSMKQAVVKDFVEHGLLKQQVQGRQRVSYYLTEEKALHAYLKNHYGINNLLQYVRLAGRESLSRTEAIEISSDSKFKAIRTFKGFLVNCYEPIAASLNGNPFPLQPQEGSFVFVYDFENFHVPSNVTVVGIENPENFRFIRKQQYLFPNVIPLFVSRYPQTKDLIRWLRTIPNPYLHFGDFDPAGIGLYLSEFKQHLGDRARFFIPDKLEELIQRFGNRGLYDNQLHLLPGTGTVEDEQLLELIEVLHKYKKGLEQEIFLNNSGKTALR